ncbi:MAG: bifunctional folylpolyglutamate synthase/dihydrofolate synthase [Niabella sp.]
MNYSEAVDFLFSRLPMFSRIGSDAIKNGLTNIIALCEALGQPQNKCKYVHVAGTNGKGSVSHMMASVLQTAGYKTGLYTSPHLKDFRERIKINGAEISEEEVILFTEKLTPLIETLQPSFFEITVAMAFNHFAYHHCDMAVIETGLGGRLDSTNIITPEISIITNIGYDHVQILGNSLKEIATEKAGIIKAGKPVVIGTSQDETEKIFIEIAEKNTAPIFFADKQWLVSNWYYEAEDLVVELAAKHQTDHHKYTIDLTGYYQTQNILPVITACRILQNEGWNISEAAIKKGLAHTKKNTGLHGRWETVHKNPRIILEVAHNPDGIQQVLNQLEITSYHKLHLVIGMVKDKDVKKVLSMLPANATYYFTNAHVPRAMAGSQLQTNAIDYNLYGTVFQNVNEAIKNALFHAHKDDLILVCGSVFLIGEVSLPF